MNDIVVRSFARYSTDRRPSDRPAGRPTIQPATQPTVADGPTNKQTERQTDRQRPYTRKRRRSDGRSVVRCSEQRAPSERGVTKGVVFFFLFLRRMCDLIIKNKLSGSTMGLDIKTVALLQEEKLQMERGVDMDDRSVKGFMGTNKRKKKRGRGRRKKKKKIPR